MRTGSKKSRKLSRGARRYRKDTLGIPGLPQEFILGGIPRDTPVFKGKRTKKLIPNEPPPSWDDIVKDTEESR